MRGSVRLAFGSPSAYSSRSCEARFVIIDQTSRGLCGLVVPPVVQAVVSQRVPIRLFEKLPTRLFALRLPA